MTKNIKLIMLFLFSILSIFVCTNVYAKDLKISLEDVKLAEKNGEVTVSDIEHIDYTVNSDIKFKNKDDYIILEVELKNNSSEDYTIVSINDNNTLNNLKISYDFNEEFKAGESYKFKIKLLYNEKVVNRDSISLSDLKVTLNIMDSEGEIHGEDIINPTTGDGILHYLGLFIISIIGVVLLIKKTAITIKNKKYKVGIFVLLLALIILPFSIFAVDEYKVELTFKEITLESEYLDYTVSFNTNGGNVIDSRTVTYGQPIGDLPQGEKNGYTFNNWKDKNGNTVTSNTIVTGELELTADFTPIEYDIHYNLNQGSAVTKDKYTIEDEFTLPTPTRLGYTFTGWSGTGISGTQLFVTISHETGEKSFTAHWSKNQNTRYYVDHKYETLNGDYTTETVEESGPTDNTVSAPVQPRTGFKTPTQKNVTITGDEQARVEYVYDREEYTFSISDRTYLTNASTANGTYKYGYTVTLEAQERPGYTFKWSDDDTNYTKTFDISSNTSLTPIYTANTDTPYNIVHKYETLNGGWEIVNDPGTGTTDTTIPAPVQPRTGFTTPTQQNITITGDVEASVTYEYLREEYTFGVTDRTYLTNASTANGTYKYGYTVTLEAQERPGYTFKWSDDDTNYTKTFDISSNISLTPIYTANTNTKYYVDHKYQTLNGDYTTETVEESGTTDDIVTAPVQPRTGFVTPSLQQITITGDGQARVEYVYDREEYTLTINHPEYINEGDISGSYYYGQEVTLTAKERDGYTFVKWSNDETANPLTITLEGNLTIEPIYQSDVYTVTYNVNGGSSIDAQIVSDGEKATRPATDPTKNGYTFVDWYKNSELTIVFNFNTPITEDTTIYAKWKKEQFPVVFSHEGECTFNGSDGVITGDDCEYANGVNKYIDTGINLYNITNINEDYEIGFKIVSYDPDEQESQATLMNTKLEGNGNPGVVFRRSDPSPQFDLSSKSTSTANVRKYINIAGITDVKIYRIYNSELDTQEIFYSINDGEKIKLNDLSQFNPIFNLSVWFGAAPKDATGNEAQRYLKGTLSNMYIKVGTYGEERDKFEVTFDTDGGSNVESQIVRKGGVAIRPLYIPTKIGYSFVDWYADSELTTLYDFTTPINDDTTIYAKFEADPLSLVFSHEGECTFNGKAGVLTGDNCAFADGIRKYIDTGINLYNSENHDKDYEIGFTIVSYSLENQDSQATFMNTKYEASNYPGVVFRRRNGASEFDLSSRKTTSANETKLFEFGTINKFKLYRIYNSESDVQEIFYSINDGEKVKLNDLSKYNPEFDLSVWFGASPTDETATEARRYLTGTLSDMYIKLGTYHEEESNNYTVTLNPNGGSVSPTSITHEKNVAIGELPSPTAPVGKIFDGWYTGLTDGIKVTNTYIPSGNITIYARYTDALTVTFDTDGGSAVAPQTIEYGGKATRPSTDPTKEGYTFDNWYTTSNYNTVFDFTNTTITTNTTIFAKFNFIDPCNGFSTDSWDTIKTNVDSDVSYYPVGCTKTIDMGTYGNQEIRVANNTIPSECNNTGFSESACGFVLEFTNSILESKANYGQTSIGGWENSNIRTKLNTTIYNQLPLELRSVIKSSTVISNVSGGNNSTTSDKLYLLSEREVNNNTEYDTSATYTRQLDYYKQKGVTTSKNISYTIKRVNGSPEAWWLRKSGSSYFVYIRETGIVDGTYANSNYGVSPAFRIGNVSSSYTITYDTDGGSTIDNQTVFEGDSAIKPENPTKEGYVFDNWFTDDTYETLFDFYSVIDHDTTIYAHFKLSSSDVCDNNINNTRLSNNTCANNENIVVGNGIVCKRATRLHEEKCGNGSCKDSSYSIGDTITYGNCGTDGVLNSGDAFTCDVNGDGTFDELTERFYYVSEYYNTTLKQFDTTTATLIYYNNVSNGISCNNGEAHYYNNEGMNGLNYKGPDNGLLSQLPTTSIWNNTMLKYNKQAILAEDQNKHDYSTVTSTKYELPTAFSYDGYSSRLMVAKELFSACNMTSTPIGNPIIGELDVCNYLLENTIFSDSDLKDNYWLNTPIQSVYDSMWIISPSDRAVRSVMAKSSATNVRPVIEVPKSAIAYGASTIYYTVTFDANGGSVDQNYATVESGNSVGTLPIPTAPEGKEFDGWYTSISDGNKIDDTYMPATNITVYAIYNDIDLCNGFSTDSWDTITNNLDSDPDYYPIGCTKTIDFDNNNDGVDETYTVRLANTSTPDSCSSEDYSQTACGTVIEFVDIIRSGKMETTASSLYGWPQTYMRSYVNTDLYSSLPNDLKENIITTKVVSGHQSGQTDNFVTEDKIYLLSTYELAGSSFHDSVTSSYTRQFDYYQTVGNNFGKRNKNGNLQEWWLRSAANSTDTVYTLVGKSNLTTPGSANYLYGISPAFRIGVMEKKTIDLNPNGGTISQSSITIQNGSQIGSIPIPEAPNNSVFIGWYTDLTDGVQVDNSYIVNNNTTLYAHYSSCGTFATDSWNDIVTNVSNKSDYYAVGCTKPVNLDLDNNGTFETTTNVRLLNNTTSSSCGTSGYSESACGFVLDFENILFDYQMNNTPNYIAWQLIGLRSYLNDTFYNSLPNDLKDVIISSSILSSDMSAVRTTVDKIYLPEVVEVYNRDYGLGVNATKTTQFDYYKLYGSTPIKRNLNGNADQYFLRSYYGSTSKNGLYYAINEKGYLNVYHETDVYGVSPVFRIGNN